MMTKLKQKLKNLRTKELKRIILFLIIVLAGFLRIYRLDQYPAGLNADEAAIGYNAYSLIQTGKDEHGNFWPIHFKSFGDYKPGLYFYLVLPFVKILGLNVWAVRLPSAILGVLSVWLVYLLVRELLTNSSTSQDVRQLAEQPPRFFLGSLAATSQLSLLASLLLAISPWHLHFSRGGWEANAATFLILVGVFGVLRGFRDSKFFVFSSLSFVLSLYAYHSARVIVPLLGFGLILIYGKELRTRFFSDSKKWLFLGCFVAFVLLIPLVKDFLGPAGISRFSGVGLLADEGPYWRVNEQRGEHQRWNSIWIRVLHNRPIAYGLSFLENWADHFHGEFLFLSGDPIIRNRIPETGQMYLVEIPFLLLGAWFLLRNKPRGYLFVFWWLVVAPVAAALTFQTPHALRAHNMVIPLAIITAYGLYQFVVWLRMHLNFKLRVACCVLLVAFYFWSLARYLHQYYVHYPQTYPEAWEYGFEELVNYVKDIEQQYDKIYVTDKYDQPYILFLFYLEYPPERFQNEVVLTPRDKFGFSTVSDFGKFHFGQINWEEMKKTSNALIIGADSEIPDSVETLKIINFPNDQTAFKVVKT